MLWGRYQILEGTHKMKTLTNLAATALLLAGGNALAQDVPETTSPPEAVTVQPQDVPPAEPTHPLDPAHGAHEASPMPQTAFTDTQVSAFAAAALAMREVRADPALDDAGKRAQAEAVVTEHGLDPVTYQAIGSAAQEDPALANRIQQAIDALAQEPGAQPPGE